jgi:FkbM family methyltransferase
MTQTAIRPRFRCPPAMRPHVASVFAGEYLVPGMDAAFQQSEITRRQGLRIVDVGANVGAFTVWCTLRYGTGVHEPIRLTEVECYEPEPSNAAMLHENVGAAVAAVATPDMRHPVVTVHQSAVFARGTASLYLGANNEGEPSLWKGHEQRSDSVEVECISAADLAPCDYLKVDTEGAELAVYLGLPRDNLDRLIATAYEWHDPRDRAVIASFLSATGFALISEDVRARDRGVARWLRKDTR